MYTHPKQVYNAHCLRVCVCNGTYTHVTAEDVISSIFWVNNQSRLKIKHWVRAITRYRNECWASEANQINTMHSRRALARGYNLSPSPGVVDDVFAWSSWRSTVNGLDISVLLMHTNTLSLSSSMMIFFSLFLPFQTFRNLCASSTTTIITQRPMISKT